MKAFLDRPIEGECPYLWIDATYLKVRRGGRIVPVAVIIAVGVNTDGRREVLVMRDRHVRSRSDLDRVPAQADQAVPARVPCLASSPMLRRAPKHPFRRRSAILGNAAGSTSCAMPQLMPERSDAVLSPPSSPRLLLRTHRRPQATQWRNVADQIRPKVPKLASPHGQCRVGRARLHDLSQAALGQTSSDKPDRTTQWRDQAPHRSRRQSSSTTKPPSASSAHCSWKQKRLNGPSNGPAT